MDGNNTSASFIWSIADGLRGAFRADEYGEIVIPFTILRRMDCVLEPTKQTVLDKAKEIEHLPEAVRDTMLRNVAGKDISFYNTSPFTLKTVLEQPSSLKENLLAYLNGFSESVSDIFEDFSMEAKIERLAKNDLLFLILQKFASADFHPDKISNHEMGLLFEELIRRFAEDSASDNGEFFTPRDAITLVTKLIFAPDEEIFHENKALLRTIYDPTAGTGGMLSIAAEELYEMNPSAKLELYGQELNHESYAICKSDMIAKGQQVLNIKQGDTLMEDKHAGHQFDYVISNPPYGSNWEKQKATVEREHRDQGFNGRFGPGLPASSDGQLLFLLHAVSKMRPTAKGGARAGIILNGSSLFTGDAGSGPSNIRRWLFENDLVDTIVGLPTNMFYSTGISTYIWILDNNKPEDRRGKVTLINASEVYTKMRKNLGDKSRMLSPANIEGVLAAYHDREGADSIEVKIFNNEDFGFRVVTVEQPLRTQYAWGDTAERNLRALNSFGKLDEKRQEEVFQFAQTYLAAQTYPSYAAFDNALTSAMKAGSAKLSATDRKMFTDAMADKTLGAGETSLDKKGNLLSDPELRDAEVIPLSEEVESYIEREVLPFTPDAWVDEAKTKIGYEISFNRYFYKAVKQRSVAEINVELQKKVEKLMALLGEKN